jgi:hypothetical protein
MPAIAGLSSVAYLPPVADARFLSEVADTLERLRSESEERGHPLLAALIAIAKGDAEDGLKTHANSVRTRATRQEADEGAVRMAQKLACRAG